MTTFRTVAQPILVALALALGVRSAIRIYSIPTASMSPTLRVGDHIVVTPYHGAAPKRGDVVVFHSPTSLNDLLVKRIVAVPGDLVETHEGRLFIGGHAAAEPYVIAPATTGTIASQVIPPGFFFVLGDNRANSFDSRQWGVLQRDLVIGRARLVLWSSGSGTMPPQASAEVVSHRSGGSRNLHLDRLFKPIQ
ncbi:MAG TPA: signal peptidase I [Thermoanaerobaculia bacterium]|nr:signal peptidase I [Thermoanaerobaculia bacterium]